MKNLSYSNLKEKVKKANKKEFIALLAVIWWIPGGFLWCTIAIWIRYSLKSKKFFGFNHK